MLQCMIIEDEPLARRLLEQYIDKTPTLHLSHSFNNPLAALDVLRTDPPQILFLDVQMPEITGITLLKILQNKPQIILTTAFSEYALESYEFDVTDYLLKPITYERFLKAADKATERHDQIQSLKTIPEDNPQSKAEWNDQFIFVKDGTVMLKVMLKDIMYIEGLKDYVKFHLPDKKITTLQRMKNLEELLSPDYFIRVHNSYIVSISWIESIQRDKIQIKGNVIPISDSYRKSFMNHIDNLNRGI
jgi:two-component system, LytTR family, response regulator